MKTFFGLMIALLIAAPAMAQGLQETGYEGKLVEGNSTEKVTLFLRKVEGREGSYFGLMMKSKDRMALYLVDPVNSSSYSLIPLEVTADGHVGIVDDNPSLVLTLGGASLGKTEFKILGSGSGNTRAFQGSMSFDGKISKEKWVDVVAGEYDSPGQKRSVQISNFDPKEKEAAAVFALKTLSGTYTLSKRQPGMYLINQNVYFATGTETNKIPAAIVVFLEKSDVRMFVVNPRNDKDLSVFERR